MNTRLPKSTLLRTAVHEAGHAVVSQMFGMRCLQVGFQLNETRTWDGFVQTCTSDGRRSFRRKQCLCLDVAGIAAEVLAFGNISAGCTQDMAQAVETATAMLRARQKFDLPRVTRCESNRMVKLPLPVPCSKRAMRLMSSAFVATLTLLHGWKPRLLGLAGYFRSRVNRASIPNVVFPGQLVTDAIEKGWTHDRQ